MVAGVDARRVNRSLVLAAVLRARLTDRRSLAAETALSEPTVSRLVDELHADGLVTVLRGVSTGRRGRPTEIVEPADGLGLAVGIDLGATNCRMVAADISGRVVGQRVVAARPELTVGRLSRWLTEQVESLLADAGMDAGDPSVPRTTVVGVPGSVALGGRRVHEALNLPQIEGTAFARDLCRRFGGRVELDNDVNVALHGELNYGAARDAATAVMFTIGTGVGTAVAVGRRIVVGGRGVAGEFGYLPAGLDGPPLHRVVTAAGLEAYARSLGATVTDTREIFTRRTKTMQRVRDRFESALAFAVSVATLAYDPDVVVLGGGVVGSIDPAMLDRLGQRLAETIPYRPPIVFSAFGEMSGAIGAVVRAVDLLHTHIGLDNALIARYPLRGPAEGLITVPSGPAR